MWLDQLPIDVCERIFRNLLIEWDPVTNIYCDVAALSRASDKQKEAAMLAVPAHRAYIQGYDHAEETFNELLAPNLQSLSLGRPVVPGDEPLFRAPNLYAAAMHADLGSLNAVAGSSSLRSLSLFVPSEESSWDAIVECLRTLRLEELMLQYSRWAHYDAENCPCVPLEGSSSGSSARLEAILSALPELQHLVIRCDVHKEHLEQITNRIVQLPNITKVNVISDEPSIHKQRAQKLRDIIVDGSTLHMFETALSLGPLLTQFFGTKATLNAQELVQLKKCSNLKVMYIALEQGAEADLADVVRVLTKLQRMELFWPSREKEDDEGHPIRPSYSAFPGSIPRAVQAGKKLIELKICNATLEALELEQVLRSLGKRLRSFALTVSYADLQGLACLQKCLDCILQYNPFLNKIEVNWQGYVRMDPYSAKACHKGPIRQLLRSTRHLYIRNKIASLPYFLIALRGYYKLAFEYGILLGQGDSESDSFEEEGMESHEIAMEE